MGILDTLTNLLSSPGAKGIEGQLESAVIPVVLGQVLGNGNQGGLSAIVAKLQQAGFGDLRFWRNNCRPPWITRAPTAAFRIQPETGASGFPEQGK